MKKTTRNVFIFLLLLAVIGFVYMFYTASGPSTVNASATAQPVKPVETEPATVKQNAVPVVNKSTATPEPMSTPEPTATPKLTPTPEPTPEPTVEPELGEVADEHWEALQALPDDTLFVSEVYARDFKLIRQSGSYFENKKYERTLGEIDQNTVGETRLDDTATGYSFGGAIIDFDPILLIPTDPVIRICRLEFASSGVRLVDAFLVDPDDNTDCGRMFLAAIDNYKLGRPIWTGIPGAVPEEPNVY